MTYLTTIWFSFKSTSAQLGLVHQSFFQTILKTVLLCTQIERHPSQVDCLKYNAGVFAGSATPTGSDKIITFNFLFGLQTCWSDA